MSPRAYSLLRSIGQNFRKSQFDWSKYLALNMISNGEFSDPLYDRKNRGHTLLRLSLQCYNDLYLSWLTVCSVIMTCNWVDVQFYKECSNDATELTYSDLWLSWLTVTCDWVDLHAAWIWCCSVPARTDNPRHCQTHMPPQTWQHGPHDSVCWRWDHLLHPSHCNTITDWLTYVSQNIRNISNINI